MKHEPSWIVFGIRRRKASTRRRIRELVSSHIFADKRDTDDFEHAMKRCGVIRGGDGFCVRTRESTIRRQRHRLGGDHAKVVRAQGASRIQCVRQRIQLFARHDVNFQLTTVLDERS